MSNALARLRAAFRDDLLVRAGGGLEPTARALELVGPVGEVLARVRADILQEKHFDPATLDRTFYVAASDYSLVVLVGRVVERVAAEAPGVRVVVRSAPVKRIPWLLDDGDIDLAVSHGLALSSWQKSAPLFTEDYACVYDAPACGFAGRLTLKRYQSFPHILCGVRDELVDSVDEMLSTAGAKKRVILSTQHMLSVPYLVSGKAVLATVPRRIAAQTAALMGLTVSPLPIELETVQMVLAWHGRYESSPAQSWLRQIFLTEARVV